MSLFIEMLRTVYASLSESFVHVHEVNMFIFTGTPQQLYEPVDLPRVQ